MKSRGSPRCCARSTISLYVTVNDVFFFSMKRYVTMCPSIGRVVFRLFGDTYPDPMLLVSVLLLSFSDICEPFAFVVVSYPMVRFYGHLASNTP